MYRGRCVRRSFDAGAMASGMLPFRPDATSERSRHTNEVLARQGEGYMGKLSWFVAGAATALTAAAISKELEKPAAQRTWRGTIAGVPYNFNVPSWGQIAREYWNADSK